MLNLTTNPTRALQAFQVIRFAAMLTTGIGMAQLGYGKTAIGSFEAVLFLSGLLTTFWITGLIQALLPLYSYHGNNANVDSRIFNVFLVVFSLTILSIVVAYAFGFALVRFAAIENMHIYHLMLLYMLFSTPAVMVEYIYLLHGKYKTMLTYGLVTYLIQIILVLLPVVLGLDVVYAVLGLISVSVIRFIWLVVLIASKSSISINIPFLKDFLKDGIPLSLKFFVSSSGLYIDQLIIGYFYDSSTFAVYRFGAREIPLVTILVVGLSNSLLADFGNRQKLNQTLEKLKIESLKLMHILFPIAIASILLATWLFPFIFGEDFQDSANVFMIYCLIVISRVLFPQTVTQGLRQNMAVLHISLIEMTLNICLSLLLIKPYGIYGVAAATVIVYTIEKFLLVAYNSYWLNIPAKSYLSVKPFLVYSAGMLLAFAIAWNFF